LSAAPAPSGPRASAAPVLSAAPAPSGPRASAAPAPSAAPASYAAPVLTVALPATVSTVAAAITSPRASAAPAPSGPRASAAPAPSAAPVLSAAPAPSGPRASAAPVLTVALPATVSTVAAAITSPRASGAPAPSAAPVLSAAPAPSGPRASGAPALSVVLPTTVSLAAAALTSPRLSQAPPKQTFSQWVGQQSVPTTSTYDRELNVSAQFNLESWTKDIEDALAKHRAENPVPELPTNTFPSLAAQFSLPGPQSFSADSSLSLFPLLDNSLGSSVFSSPFNTLNTGLFSQWGFDGHFNHGLGF